MFGDFLGDSQDLTSFGSRQQESFVIKEIGDGNTKDDRTVEQRLGEYIDSMSGNWNGYIIYNGEVTDIVISENYRPLSITMKRPNRIKYNFGYFMPRFYDIIRFVTNDFDLGHATDMSLLLANTKVKEVNRVNTYTGNKIFPKNNEIEVTKNYFITYQKSVFASNWDKKYYRSYDSETKYTELDGYVPGIDDKSFFGSRCFVLKDNSIVIDDFSSPKVNPRVSYQNATYNTYSENRIQCRITINITQSIYSFFENNEVFSRNWEGLPGESDTARRNYIQNTVSKIYNTQRRRDVVLYNRMSDNGQTNVVFDASEVGDINNWSVTEDFETHVSISDNDMYLDIIITVKEGVQLHPQIKIYRN